MRIISPFSDYYDGVGAIDSDDEPCYVRQTQRHIIGELSLAQRQALFGQVGALWSTTTTPPQPLYLGDATRVVVGFCGRAYAGFRVLGAIAWDVEGVIALVQQLDRRAAAAAEIDVKQALAQLESTRASAWQDGLSRGTWQRHLRTALPDVGVAPFVALRAPVVVVTPAPPRASVTARAYAFDNLTRNITKAIEKLGPDAALSADNIKEPLRDIRRALLEADVSLPVVRQFVKAVEGKAIGAEVVKGITPGQQLVKVVSDQLQELMGSEVRITLYRSQASAWLRPYRDLVRLTSFPQIHSDLITS